MIGTPEPPLPYIVERAFPELKFVEPVDLCAAPETDRLFVAELKGKIFSFPNRADVRQPDLFFDLTNSIPDGRTVYGLAFHPGFETNRFVFICYVTRDGLPDGSRVSRFTVRESDPPQVEPASEKMIITWLAGGHNGGSLKFGPDGYLYISTGDAAGPNPPDPRKTGQDNRDLLSCILRIDVDGAEPGQSYRVPPDNPFVSTPGCRPEIWAYGLRNPWRMSFDRMTGELWVGDVGWELWELIYRVERGGNYGWSIVEGEQPIRPELERGPTPILPPTKAHPHSEAASITGGFVYRGTRLPGIQGAYVYGDWATGKIWGLRTNDSGGVTVNELVDTPYQIVAFGEDNSGEIYIVDYAGTLLRLAPNAATKQAGDFPRTLRDTGLFRSVINHELAPGVLPFWINAEMWADHAFAERFVGFPGQSAIKTGATDVWIYQSKKEWRFPTNAVLAKTLSLEMDRGKRESARRIETQLLHFDGLDWRAYSYRWNHDQTDAVLVPPEGDEATLHIADSTAPGGRRMHRWRFHSRAECLRCHNPWMNHALAFTALQLNRNIGDTSDANTPAAQPANQLELLSRLGYFDQPVDTRSVKLTNPYSGSDEPDDLMQRARSWLHVNCAHCHREGAGGSVPTHLDFDTKLSNMKAIDREPSQGAFGISNPHVITAGDPYSSVLYYRILTTGQGRMPLMGSRVVDIAGAKLIHDWIATLSKENPSAAQNSTRIESMPEKLESTRDALMWVTATDKKAVPILPAELEKIAAEHASFAVRDLLERFLPEEKRSRKLGASFDPADVLALSGDAERGRKLFFQEGAQCAQCHRVDGQGRDFGPDLSAIGARYDRKQLLEHLVEPSKQIEPAYAGYLIETTDGELYSGILVSQTADEIVIKDATAEQIRLSPRSVKSRSQQKMSAMPEGLLQNMTPLEAADLVEFLATRKPRN